MDNEQELNTTMKIVQNLLETDEKCRNSDHWLIIETLRTLGFKIYINYDEIKDMPSFETISRCRRKIQETNPSLRAEDHIQELRDNKSEIFKKLIYEMKDSTRGVSVDSIPIRRTIGIPVHSR